MILGAVIHEPLFQIVLAFFWSMCFNERLPHFRFLDLQSL
jgi:hypothetical protein